MVELILALATLCWPYQPITKCDDYVEAIGIGESRRSDGEARAWSRQAAFDAMDQLCRDKNYKRVTLTGYQEPDCSKSDGLWHCSVLGTGWCSKDEPQP